MKPEEEREQQGITAILYLQQLGGRKETKEQATKGWRGMTQREQDFTLEFYNIAKGNK